jgi:hypothetical protein
MRRPRTGEQAASSPSRSGSATLRSRTVVLTAGFPHTSVVDALYRHAGYDIGHLEDATLASLTLASLCDEPAALQPRTAWGYGNSSLVWQRIAPGMRWSAYAAMPKPLGSERRMTFLQPDRTCRASDPVV